MSSITDALGWLAGAFYVIVALSIVYLFFFRIVPLVLGKISWDIWSLIRGVLVLAALAFLLGCVAIFTADWIFSQVLDTLPRTRMAREVDRVTGSLVRLSADTGYGSSAGGTAPFLGGILPSTSGSSGVNLENVLPGSTPDPALSMAMVAPNMQPKANAMQLWATWVQTEYNPTGNFSDNGQVMTKRDLPQGVTCEVSLVAGGWKTKGYEEWRLHCSNDGFRSSLDMQVNGTAARGLTGGGSYGPENPLSVYGTGPWPEMALEPALPPVMPTPIPGGAPQGGPSEAPTPGVPVKEHKVRPGDSLAAIAQAYSIPVSQIVEANEQKYPQLQSNPNVIGIGWVLAIPDETQQ